ncbi:MAG: diacylglycerol kinase [Lautropia sp.]
MDSSDLKSVGGLRRIANACVYSLRGLGAAFRHEAAFRQELAAGIVLLPLALWLPRSWAGTIALIAALLLILLVELLNSAIEAVADAVSLELRPLLGRAKDIGSAAVMLAMVIAALVWAAVLLAGW